MVPQAVEWADTCTQSHDPFHSSSERWAPSRPSSEALLMFCRPASNDPPSTPGTHAAVEPLDFTLPPVSASPTLPFTLHEECSTCSAAELSRRSSHLSQASLLSLSAPACAQDAIMSFDTLFSTASSAQLLDSFSCQAALQVGVPACRIRAAFRWTAFRTRCGAEQGDGGGSGPAALIAAGPCACWCLQERCCDEQAGSCYWGFISSTSRAAGPSQAPARPFPLQPLPEAPWLLNSEVGASGGS